MPVSYPSRVATVLDVPEVKDLSASFKYYFFTPDEKVNDSGDPRLQGVTNVKEIKEFKKRIPRFVLINFTPVDIRTNESADERFVLDISDPKKVENIIFSNLNKIQNEIDVSSAGYSSLILQDQEVQQKSSNFFMTSLKSRVLSLKLGDSYVTGEKGWQYTRTGVAKALNNTTSDLVSGKWISSAIGNLEKRSVIFYKTDLSKREPYSPEWFENFSSIKQYSQINDKFVHDILMKAISDPASPYSNELSFKIKHASEIQDAARKNGDPSSISDYEYTSSIIPISITRIDPRKFTNDAKIIGYIVDKSELSPDRNLRECEPIIVAGSNARAVIDTKVKYSSTYTYSIRSITLAQFQAVDEETAQVYAISCLISSRPSKKVSINCQEKRPPEPPTDLDFIWDYKEKKLMVMWSFPITPQRDVKRFQVFKRESIYVPFELQIEYDFDDSEIPEPRKEQPTKSRVIDMQSPLTTYWDEEFTKQSIAIYAICSVDAHDFSSNYSAQFVVWFDEVKNRLMKKLISPSGAPKPYPNFYLVEGADPANGEINLTSDSMRDSGHTSCKIYFDPEYLSVKGKHDDDLDFLSTTKEGGSYKLQFINVDRQKSQIVDIKIDDLRTEK